ncbi:hypothetical protein TNCV_4717521 [Trichonephila clavipes]|nr:hypothetical protein TNCV_4717521 [Trichonephila clavipes]
MVVRYPCRLIYTSFLGVVESRVLQRCINAPRVVSKLFQPSVGAQSPHVGIMGNLEDWNAGSGIILVS